jgi:hypothetical protein
MTYHIIPGICVTHTRTLSNCGDELKTNFPKGINCLILYKDKYCNGEKRIISSEKDIKDAFPQYKSMMLCGSSMG